MVVLKVIETSPLGNSMRKCVCLRMYCLKHTLFCFVLFFLSIAQLARRRLLYVNCSPTLGKFEVENVSWDLEKRFS